jgi:hypothetical protein
MANSGWTQTSLLILDAGQRNGRTCAKQMRPLLYQFTSG